MNTYDSDLLSWIHRSGTGKPTPLYSKPNFSLTDYPAPTIQRKVTPPDTSMYQNYVSVYNLKEEKYFSLDVNAVTAVRSSFHFDDGLYIQLGYEATGIVISNLEFERYVEPALKLLHKKVDKRNGRVIHIDD